MTEKTLQMHLWNDVLVGILNAPKHSRYSERLSFRLNITRNHIRVIVKVLEAYGLIHIHAGKKVKWLELTEKGKEVANSVLKIKAALKDGDARAKNAT